MARPSVTQIATAVQSHPVEAAQILGELGRIAEADPNILSDAATSYLTNNWVGFVMKHPKEVAGLAEMLHKSPTLLALLSDLSTTVP